MLADTDRAIDALHAIPPDLDRDSWVLVIRLDKALMMFSGPPAIPNGTCPKKSPKIALIVRDDQHDFWSEYAQRMAGMGIEYLVCWESHAALAYEWAEITAPFRK